MLVPVASITSSPRGPVATPADQAALAESIRNHGLLQPIVITAKNAVVAGRKRFAAVQSLGWEEVECNVLGEEVEDLEIAIIEIDENLCRTEYTALDRAAAMAERKQLYEMLHPEAAKLGPKETAAFVADTAAKTGKSTRTVAREAAVGRKLTPAAREVLVGTPAADEITTLEKVARLPPEKQVAAAKQATVKPDKSEASPAKRLSAMKADLERIMRAADKLHEDEPSHNNHRNTLLGIKLACDAITCWAEEYA